MKETIGSYADIIGTVAMIVMLCSFTVEAVAKDKAMMAAIFSPMAVICMILFAFLLADRLGLVD
ncbi:hypothetical protein [Thioclava sp. GXIMD4215]|uniref:hypothetical protein n=1 Tax=Thioclava sp. GXIMD4215 TaxID=3131928 RepID=UPI003255747D